MGAPILAFRASGGRRSRHNRQGLAKDAQVNYLWRAIISDRHNTQRAMTQNIENVDLFSPYKLGRWNCPIGS